MNIIFTEKELIADRAQGSFQIAQLICSKLCVLNKIIETCDPMINVDTSIEVAVEDVMIDLGRMFKEPTQTFARGSKLRREGRAPYLHILNWLAASTDWSLDLAEARNTHPKHKASIGQVIEKDYLVALLNDPDKHDVLSPHFHYEPSTAILSVEDPKLIFYLKNIVWRTFTRQVGFTTDYFTGKYDFALSFAGSEREIAKKLYDLLSEREVSVFYDKNEQHSILAHSIEEYLAPIYRSEARYILPLLSAAYPTRIWTKFESDQFKERFGDNSVIPIRFTNTTPGYFSDEQAYGSVTIDPTKEIDPQLAEIADTLCRRLMEDRQTAEK